MKDKKSGRIFNLAIFGLVALFVTGCGGSSSSNSAMVRAVHASPDAPPVDVYVDDSIAFTNLSFGESTSLTEIGAGDHTVALRVAGAEPSTDPVLETMVTLQRNSATNIIASNTLANLDFLLFDATQESPSAMSSRITVVHASPDAPIVDITLSDGTVLFDNIAFGGAVGPLEVAAGTYDLEIRDETATTTVLELPGVLFEDGANYTVYAIGLLSGTPALSVIVTEDLEPVLANLRVGHLSPDAPNVDVCLDGMVVLENVAFETVSGYLPVREGMHTLKVVGVGSPCSSDGVFEADVALAPDVDYSALAVDVFASIGPLVVVDDNSDVPVGSARLAFVHTSPDAPVVDITLTSGDVLFDDVAFGESGTIIDVPAGTYTVEVRDETGSTIVLTIPGLVLADGGSYTAFATGLLNGAPELGAILVQNNSL